ncbi:MAG: hypothetical protein JRJ35_15425 [Deltaproteobacteria bacterium]|nr:hypothetical protein [Deltaproteobacteria bacterium]MBW1950837.1 hypothetical protein [Deltaproteobacteria bacterium]MBW2008809.1 hypothetical protein [Deltaproteobacteria bacterium]
MSDRLNAEEVAILIKARQILKDKGLAKDADVKSICERAGVSRKTGYQWAESLEIVRDKGKVSEEELARLKSEQEALEERYRRLEIEHEGLKLAWEIHGVDELSAAKKTPHTNGKGKSGKVSANKAPLFEGGRLGPESLFQCVERLEPEL